MVKIREKGTRTIYSIDYSSIENAWKEKVKAEPELTEEDALQYIGERTNEMLALCDKYNFDGIIADYTGRSLVSLPEAALKEYNGRQQKFFGEVMNWQSSHDDKTLVFYGNVQYLVPENMSMLSKFDFIMSVSYTHLKAQGGQWQNVFLDQGYMTDEYLTPDYFRWLYTAFTRATKTLYLVNYPKEQIL